VADIYAIDGKTEHGIAAPFPAADIIMKSRYGMEIDTLNLSRFSQDDRVTPYSPAVVVVGMFVTDCHYISRLFDLPMPYAAIRQIRVGNDLKTRAGSD